jgi:hypothetical protein
LEEAAADARAHTITRRKAAEDAQRAVARVAAARAALVALDRLVGQRNALDLERQQKGTRLRAAETRLYGTSGWLVKRRAKRERNDAARDLAAFEQFIRHRAAQPEHIRPIRRGQVISGRWVGCGRQVHPPSCAQRCWRAVSASWIMVWGSKVGHRR